MKVSTKPRNHFTQLLCWLLPRLWREQATALQPGGQVGVCSPGGAPISPCCPRPCPGPAWHQEALPAQASGTASPASHTLFCPPHGSPASPARPSPPGPSTPRGCHPEVTRGVTGCPCRCRPPPGLPFLISSLDVPLTCHSFRDSWAGAHGGVRRGGTRPQDSETASPHTYH